MLKYFNQVWMRSWLSTTNGNLERFQLRQARNYLFNQIHAMAAAIKVRQQRFVHEGQVCFSVEVFGLVPPDKIAGGDADRPQDFLGVAFAARGDFRLLPTARPGAIQRGSLAKGRLIFINNQRPFPPGVFFRFGCVKRIQRFCFLGSACTRRVLGRCTEKFKSLSKCRTCPG